MKNQDSKKKTKNQSIMIKYRNTITLLGAMRPCLKYKVQMKNIALLQ